MMLTIVKPGFQVLTPESRILRMPSDIEEAGRTCYKSESRITDDSADRFVRMLVKQGHLSVLEHCSITVRIICDRSTSHQLVRHRIAAYSQESQRYCDYGKKGFQVIVPPSIGNFTEGCWDIDLIEQEATPNGRIWLGAIYESYMRYLELRARKVKAEDARSVLPNATKTEVVTTFNLRQWLHVFKERAQNKRAQWQIREIMLGIQNRFQELLPCIFQCDEN